MPAELLSIGPKLGPKDKTKTKDDQLKRDKEMQSREEVKAR